MLILKNIASEATTATAMHILKTIIYSKFAGMTIQTFTTGLVMGLAMVAGTLAANRYIRKMDKNKFQEYIAILLCVVGTYMLVFGS